MADPTLPTSLLVLGGTSDIAVATVAALAERGLRTVMLAGRSAPRLAEVATDLASSGLTAHHQLFDATDVASHAGAIAEMSATHGPFDAVLIAFGALGDEFDVDADPASVAELASVNFAGAMSAAIAAGQMLTASGGGTLAVISSMTAMRPRRANLIYGSAKAGLDAFCRGLDDAYAGSGVNVMVIRPGFVHSAMTEGVDPAPFATTPDEVASDIVAGFESGSSIVWSPRILRAVATVFRALPSPVWRKISNR